MRSPTPLLDDRALREPVDPSVARAESHAFFREHGGPVGEATSVGRVVLQSAIIVFGLGTLCLLLVIVVQALAGRDGVNAASFVIVALMVTPLAVMRIAGDVRSRRRRDVDWYRLRRFAAANDLEFVPVTRDPDRAAAMFGVGTSRLAYDVLRVSPPIDVEVGRYAFDTWVGRGRMPHELGYLAFARPGAGRAGTPALTISSIAPDIPARSWTPPAEQTPVAISPAFDAQFTTLAAPADHESVRGLLTDPAQRALLDLAGDCDLEVTDGDVFVLTRRTPLLAEPTMWEWVADLTALVDAVWGTPGGTPTIDDSTPPPSAVPAGDAVVSSGADARARRSAVFGGAPRRGTLTMGCLLPLLLGIAAAVATALL